MYSKEIIYIGLYQDGSKIGNAGFLKVENRERESRMELKLRNLPLTFKGRFPVRIYNGSDWKEWPGISVQEGGGDWQEQVEEDIQRVQLQMILPGGYSLEGRSKSVEKPVPQKKMTAEENEVFATKTKTDTESAYVSAVKETPSMDSAFASDTREATGIRGASASGTREETGIRGASASGTREETGVRGAFASGTREETGIGGTFASDAKEETDMGERFAFQTKEETDAGERFAIRTKGKADVSSELVFTNNKKRIPDDRIQTIAENASREADKRNMIVTEELRPSIQNKPKDNGMYAKKPPEAYDLKEDKWEQILDSYEQIHPYGDERIYVKLEPKDFIILQSKYQHLVNNSFLLHGFYNYRYIILGKESDYYLGVPGVFYEREKMVALMFGFEAFECPGGIARAGEFGYYLRKVEL